MSVEITMPQLGESVVEATLQDWLVKAGDSVTKYQPLCEVITDKVNVEVSCSIDGVVAKILIEPGTTVSVGTPICLINGVGDQSVYQKGSSEEKVSVPNSQIRASGRYSPAVLKLAKEHNIDLSQLVGTGLEGRITRKDVLAYVQNGNTEVSADTARRSELNDSASGQTPNFGQQDQHKVAYGSGSFPVWRDPEDLVITVDPIRRTIAQKMVASVTNIPHAWAMLEVDLTELVNYRNQVKEEFYKKEGVKLTYLPFFVLSVVKALQEYPILNGSWTESHIVIHKHYNMSIAVATEKALFVPVIHNADRYSPAGLAHKVKELASKAHMGKLTPDDISKGTFTVNNTGAFGSQSSMPIISPPQVGMITLESVVKRPVVINDMIAIRSMANVCLSFDHRITDGLTAGRFLHSVCRYLTESPGEKLR